MNEAPEPDERGWLHAAFAAIPARAPSPPPVDPERIWAAVHGELDQEETTALVDQLANDPQLALEWRLATALAEAAPVAEDEDPREEGGAARATQAEPAANDRRYWSASLLGAAAAAVVGVLLLRPDDPTTGPVEHDGDRPTLRTRTGGTAIVSELPDGVTLPRDRLALRWSVVPGADHYELRLTTARLDPIHQALELRTPRATIPPAALAPLDAGTDLMWQVTAVMPDGRRLDSPAWRIVVE